MKTSTIKEAIEEMKRQETTVTCHRCGKKLTITQDGDGIHTCTPQKIKQDTPIEHLAEFADKFGFGEE